MQTINFLIATQCKKEIHLLLVHLKPNVKDKYNRQYNDLLKPARPIKALPRTRTATKKIQRRIKSITTLEQSSLFY